MDAVCRVLFVAGLLGLIVFTLWQFVANATSRAVTPSAYGREPTMLIGDEGGALGYCGGKNDAPDAPSVDSVTVTARR